MNKQQKFDQFRRESPSAIQLFTPILMHFAALHIHRTYADFVRDYRVLVQANLKILEDFDVDMAWLISDPYRETSAFGAVLDYPEHGVPVCRTRIIGSSEDIESLKIPDIHKAERTCDRIRAARLLSRELQNAVPLIGWVEGPLAEACDLAGTSEMLMMLMLEPDASHRLLDKCLLLAKQFALAQIDAGCTLIGVGDAICSQIDAQTYRDFIKFRHQDLFSFIHRQGGLVKLHICGDLSHLLRDLADCPIDILDLDWQVDLSGARNILPPQTLLCGNINPVEVQNLTAEQVYERSRQLLLHHRHHRLILSAGCEITAQTPAENLTAMRRAAGEVPSS